ELPAVQRRPHSNRGEVITADRDTSHAYLDAGCPCSEPKCEKPAPGGGRCAECAAEHTAKRLKEGLGEWREGIAELKAERELMTQSELAASLPKRFKRDPKAISRHLLYVKMNPRPH